MLAAILDMVGSEWLLIYTVVFFVREFIGTEYVLGLFTMRSNPPEQFENFKKGLVSWSLHIFNHANVRDQLHPMFFKKRFFFNRHPPANYMDLMDFHIYGLRERLQDPLLFLIY